MGAKPVIQPIMAFTGLRGLASVWVVAYHFRDPLIGKIPAGVMSCLAAGYLAVDLFFILSGYVIYLNYRWMFDTLSLRACKQFIIARFARIYPVHLAVTLLFLLNPMMILLVSRTHELAGHFGVGYFSLSLLLMQNWGLTSRLDWNIPAWSISTEWFAYLVFPILLIGIGRYRDQGWILLIKLAATLSVLAGFFAIAGVSSLGENIPQLGLARCLLEFLVGAGLCRLALQTVNPPILSPILLSLTLGLVLLSLALGLADFLLLPTAFAALIFALADHGAPFGRLIACRPLVWLGEISYSLYMIHYFVKDWLKFTGGDRAGLLSFMVYLLATLVAALALHRLVERPGRRFFRRYGITHV